MNEDTVATDYQPVDDEGLLTPPIRPLANLKRLQDSITEQMNIAVKGGRVIGWASSVSRADGTDVQGGAGGYAVVGGTTREPTYYINPKTGKTTIIGYQNVTASGVPMTTTEPLVIGSCSKTVMAVATLAAQWAMATDSGHKPPVSGDELKALQDQAENLEIAGFIPPEFDKSRVNGLGFFSSSNPPGVKGALQKTPLQLKHFLRMQSYFKKDVFGAFEPSDQIDAGAYYPNIKLAVEIGPVLPNATTTIGQGHGRYSNAGYDLLRLVTGYILLQGDDLLRDAVDGADADTRDTILSTLHKNFVQDHVFKPCGASGTLHPVGRAKYYNVDATSPLRDFAYTPSRNSLRTVGGGGWVMSAHDLRLFLVGVQQGLPFGGGHAGRSWWTDMIRKKWFGSDCPWLTTGTDNNTRLPLPYGGVRRAYLKNGGSGFPFLDPANPSAEARGDSQLLVTRDATVTLLTNSGAAKGGRAGIPKTVDVVRTAYHAAVYPPP